MPVPTTESLLLPFLKSLRNGEQRTLKEVESYVASLLKLSSKDLTEQQPSGRQTKFEKN